MRTRKLWEILRSSFVIMEIDSRFYDIAQNSKKFKLNFLNTERSSDLAQEM